MLQCPLFLLRDFLIHILELEMAVYHKQQRYHDDDGWQEPPGASGLSSVEQPCSRFLIRVEDPGDIRDGIHRDTGEEPQHIAVDERTEEQIHLTVHHDQQQTGHQLPDDRPAGTGKEKDDRVGHEHTEPEEVVAAQMRRQQETLDGGVAGDGQQDIGFHHHTRRGLDHKTEQIVDDKDQRHK